MASLGQTPAYTSGKSKNRNYDNKILNGNGQYNQYFFNCIAHKLKR